MKPNRVEGTVRLGDFLSGVLQVVGDQDVDSKPDDPIRLNLSGPIDAATGDEQRESAARNRPGARWIAWGFLLIGGALFGQIITTDMREHGSAAESVARIEFSLLSVGVLGIIAVIRGLVVAIAQGYKTSR